MGRHAGTLQRCHRVCPAASDRAPEARKRPGARCRDLLPKRAIRTKRPEDGLCANATGRRWVHFRRLCADAKRQQTLHWNRSPVVRRGGPSDPDDVPLPTLTRYLRTKHGCAERPVWSGFATFETHADAASGRREPNDRCWRPRTHALDPKRNSRHQNQWPESSPGLSRASWLWSALVLPAEQLVFLVHRQPSQVADPSSVLGKRVLGVARVNPLPSSPLSAVEKFCDVDKPAKLSPHLLPRQFALGMPRKYKSDGQCVTLKDLTWKSRGVQGKVFLERPDRIVSRTGNRKSE